MFEPNAPWLHDALALALALLLAVGAGAALALAVGAGAALHRPGHNVLPAPESRYHTVSAP